MIEPSVFASRLAGRLKDAGMAKAVLSIVAATMLLAACSSQSPTTQPDQAAFQDRSTHGPVEPMAAVPTAIPFAAANPSQDPAPGGRATRVCDLSVSRAGWKTDFSKCSVPGREIISGGPPRDGIPPIDRPSFTTSSEAAGWLKDVEPVVVFEEKGEARAYPLQILIWHEIVNDEVAGRPVVVTFCPLCNTAVAFERRLDDRALDFGTTGNLRHSDLVMWDRQTESWWQQITGEAIVGELSGRRLRTLPASIASFSEFRRTFTAGVVLSRETGHARAYGNNPYIGYDDVKSSPFLFSGTADPRLRPMERVVTVSLGGEDAAYPFTLLERRRVIQDRVGDQPIVVLFGKGTVSALDSASIAASRDVGSAAVFDPNLDGRLLTFRLDGDRVVDNETGSDWNLLGQATAGPLAGERLTPVVHGNHLWFSWAVFKPSTRVAQ
jgi:hypothetical protein